MNSPLSRVTYPAAFELGMYTFLLRCGALWDEGGVHCGILAIDPLAQNTPFCYLFLLISVTPA